MHIHYIFFPTVSETSGAKYRTLSPPLPINESNFVPFTLTDTPKTSL